MMLLMFGQIEKYLCQSGFMLVPGRLKESSTPCLGDDISENDAT